MRPGTNAAPPVAMIEASGADDLAGELHAEGEGYARALLDRIGAGVAGPDELADLMTFLHAGPMLHAACAVLMLALRAALRPERESGGDAR